MAESAGWAAPPMEPPPRTVQGPLAWLRQNLFGGWGSTLITLALIYALARAGAGWIGWTVREANWGVITRNLGVLTWGRYPADQVWRLGLSLALLIVLGGATAWAWRSARGQAARRPVVAAWLLSPAVLWLLMRGLTLPTPATVANNLGYYIFRPDVLPLLEEAWRGPAALLVGGLLGGLTWAMTGRRGRWAAGAAVGALALLNLPLGLQPAASVGGLALPRALPMAAVLLVGLRAGWSTGRPLVNIRGAGRGLALAWLAAVPALILILTSFDVGVPRLAPAPVLPIVQPAIWSGIMLTVVLAAVSILGSFPIGLLLALGRRSQLPLVRIVCVGFIELVRGVPLITILFMAQVMLPLFLPLDLTIDRVVRAMAGLTLFTAAYLAEVVRGGLQAVRHEQVEAARALGLSEVMVTGLIVLPQALRAVIPAIMGQFVSIFKDTSLVAIVGLLDLLAVGQSITKQRDFIGAVREVYLFAGLFYFVLSFAMSDASRRLERRLGVGER